MQKNNAPISVLTYINLRRIIIWEHQFMASSIVSPLRLIIAEYFPSINNVIFNDPATIVFLKDGTKTVVKYQKENGDTYS